MARENEQEQKPPIRVTDIDALKDNTEASVFAFVARWTPVPELTEQCEVMDVGQLRDAMGLRATIEAGDPWPSAECLLLGLGFRWHWIGSQRVMLMQEKDGYRESGWTDVEEIEEDNE